MRGPDPRQRFKNLNLGVMTTQFGDRTEQEQVHGGIDIANEEGTPIHAPVDGIVVKVDTGHLDKENSFGNTLEIQDIEGKKYQFHHLQKVMVSMGQQIRKGTPIATIGKSGAVYSPSGSDPSNLDFRIVSTFGKYLNPMNYIKYL